MLRRRPTAQAIADHGEEVCGELRLLGLDARADRGDGGAELLKARRLARQRLVHSREDDRRGGAAVSLALDFPCQWCLLMSLTGNLDEDGPVGNLVVLSRVMRRGASAWRDSRSWSATVFFGYLPSLALRRRLAAACAWCNNTRHGRAP